MSEKSMEEPVVSLDTSTWERRNLVLMLGCSEPGDTGRAPGCGTNTLMSVP